MISKNHRLDPCGTCASTSMELIGIVVGCEGFERDMEQRDVVFLSKKIWVSSVSENFFKLIQ